MLFRQLRCHVWWSSTKYLQLLIRNYCRKTEINYLDHIRLVFNQYVVKLDIPVTHIIRMQVLNSLSYLLKHPSACLLFYYPIRTILFHMLLKRYTFDIIHHEINLFRHINKFVELHDIRMIQLSHYHNFSLNCFPLHWIIQFIFVVYFDCKFLQGSLMLTYPYMCVSTLP